MKKYKCPFCKEEIKDLESAYIKHLISKHSKSVRVGTDKKELLELIKKQKKEETIIFDESKEK